MTQRVGIKKAPIIPIESSEAVIDPVGKHIIAIAVAMKAPLDMIRSEIRNQCSFSIKMGKIIELTSPTNTKVAPIMLV